MRLNILILLGVLTFIGCNQDKLRSQDPTTKTEENIFVFGGDINLKFVQYVVDLTKKEIPKLVIYQ